MLLSPPESGSRRQCSHICTLQRPLVRGCNCDGGLEKATVLSFRPTRIWPILRWFRWCLVTKHPRTQLGRRDEGGGGDAVYDSAKSLFVFLVFGFSFHGIRRVVDYCLPGNNIYLSSGQVRAPARSDTTPRHPPSACRISSHLGSTLPRD